MALKGKVKSFIEGLSDEFLSAVLTYLGADLYDFGAVRTFHREVLLMDLLNRLGDFFLDDLVDKIIIRQWLHGAKVGKLAQVLGCLQSYTSEAVLVGKHLQDCVYIFSYIVICQGLECLFSRLRIRHFL